MSTELRQFLFSRGTVHIDGLLGACVVAWIGGVGAALLGGMVIAILKGSSMYALMSVFMAIFLIPLGICASLPFIRVLHMLGRLNGLSVMIIGSTVAAPLALAIGLMPFSAVVVFVGVGTGAAAWHAGASYSSTAV